MGPHDFHRSRMILDQYGARGTDWKNDSLIAWCFCLGCTDFSWFFWIHWLVFLGMLGWRTEGYFFFYCTGLICCWTVFSVDYGGSTFCPADWAVQLFDTMAQRHSALLQVLWCIVVAEVEISIIRKFLFKALFECYEWYVLWRSLK